MADERPQKIDNEPTQHTANHDFQGGLKKSGTDVADTSDTFSGSHTDLSDVGASDHHAKYDLTDDQVATGSVTLSSGAATIDTGVGSGTTATFLVALGPDTDDSEVTATIEAESGGNYTVHLDEINTAVGNTTVEYDIIRVR